MEVHFSAAIEAPNIKLHFYIYHPRCLILEHKHSCSTSLACGTLTCSNPLIRGIFFFLLLFAQVHQSLIFGILLCLSHEHHMYTFFDLHMTHHFIGFAKLLLWTLMCMSRWSSAFFFFFLFCRVQMYKLYAACHMIFAADAILLFVYFFICHIPPVNLPQLQCSGCTSLFCTTWLTYQTFILIFWPMFPWVPTPMFAPADLFSWTNPRCNHNRL